MEEYKRNVLLCIADGFTIAYDRQGTPVLVEDKDPEQGVELLRAIGIGYERVIEQTKEMEEDARRLQGEINQNKQLETLLQGAIVAEATGKLKKLSREEYIRQLH